MVLKQWILDAEDTDRELSSFFGSVFCEETVVNNKTLIPSHDFL